MAAYELVEERREALARAEGEHALASVGVGYLQFSLYGVGNESHALVHLGEYLGGDFLAARYLRPLDSGARTVELFRDFVQYDG